MNNAYIRASGAFLPGPGIPNEEIEDYLGLVNNKPSRYKHKVLKANGIQNRHYAVTKEGEMTYLTDELAELAIRDALTSGPYDLSDISFLSAGTSFPDLIAPGFSSMVHGRLGGQPMEIVTCGGICGSGIAAIKAAVNAIRLGEHKQTVAVAAERLSRLLLAKRFANENTNLRRSEVEDGFHYFNGEFLRWMLSDGAGALIFDNEPSKTGVSLKVEWVDVRSYANELPLCMFMGADSIEDLGPGRTWLDDTTDTDKLSRNLILRQDSALLNQHHSTAFSRHLKDLHDVGKFKDSDITYYIPHMSSYFFQQRIAEGMKEAGVDIDMERWYTNLSTRGNTGSAAIYIAIDECLKAGKFKKGDKILCFIPESGRFLSSFMLLTAV